jgi:preprotein translocase subunit SecA
MTTSATDGTGPGTDRERVPAAATAGAASAGAATVTAASGSAILRGGPAAQPTQRVMRESLGDEPVSSGGGSASGPKPGFTPSGERIGRNDPCWCGSGAKYKKCHGR